MIDHITDTMTLQFKVNPSNKDILFNDCKTGVVYGVRERWKRKKLRNPKSKTKIHFTGKNALYFYYPSYDRFFKKSYPFTGDYGYYSLDYCHYKYRNDCVLVTLKHNAIINKSKYEILQDTLEFLDSIGIDREFLEIENNLNRIDFKHDFEFEYNPSAERQALMCILNISRDEYYGVCKEELKKGSGIKYNPISSYTEVIVYDKEQERKNRLKTRKKSSQVELDVEEYKNVFRTELRLKNKRLYYNKNNTLKIDKTLDNYYNEEISDECFRRYVEPIFYKEPFYRLDYAILAIQSDRRLTEKEAEKLCQLVTDINKKGFTKAKEEYKYSDDTFEHHIKLLRSIGINPLTFDEDIDIPFLLNFTTKEVCRDFSIYDGEHEELKQKLYDELGV